MSNDVWEAATVIRPLMPLAGFSTHGEVLRLNLDGAPDLFDVPRDGKSSGLVWFLSREAAPEHAMTESSQMFDRLAMPGDSIVDIEHGMPAKGAA